MLYYIILLYYYYIILYYIILYFILYYIILYYIMYNYFTYHSPNPRTNQPTSTSTKPLSGPIRPQAPGDVADAAACGHATADALSGTHRTAESR